MKYLSHLPHRNDYWYIETAFKLITVTDNYFPQIITLYSTLWNHRIQFNLLKPSGFFTYHQGLTFKNSTWCSLCVECFVRISEQTATFVLYIINWLVFITVVESVYSTVRTESLNKAVCASSLKGWYSVGINTVSLWNQKAWECYTVNVPLTSFSTSRRSLKFK